MMVVFQFERLMKTGKKDIEITMFRIPITDKGINASKGEALPEGGYVCVLQMILTEETPKEEDGSESPIRFIGTGGDGKLGKELGGIRTEHLHLIKSQSDQSCVDASVNVSASVNASASVNGSVSNAITTTTTTILDYYIFGYRSWWCRCIISISSRRRYIT